MKMKVKNETVYAILASLFALSVSACGTEPVKMATDPSATTTSSDREGPQGEKGEAGAQGPKGDKGDKGEAGASGKAGSAGAAATNGTDGADGAQGAAGAQGVAGQQGIQGIAGAAGTTGVAGAAGAQGAAGTAGTPAVQTKVIDSASGTVLGEVMWLAAGGDIWMVNGALRFVLQNTTGTWPFPNAFLLYPQANCAGTPVLTLTNGTWANVFLDGRDNTTVWGIHAGARKAAFTYASRVAASSGCQNTSGTADGWQADHNPTLPFSYPLNSIEFAN